MLSGVSTEWYTRLEKGHITGVSEEVLTAVARALQLNDDERAYLLDLAKAARPTIKPAARPKDVNVEGSVKWLIDSVTMSAVFLRNGRLDVLASNSLGRALHAPMFDSPTTIGGRANFARFHFLDPASRDFFVDWEGGASATVALLRAEAGREPNDRTLRELIGELSTRSHDFTRLWSSHDVRSRHEGIKRLDHPVVGYLELTLRRTGRPEPRGPHAQHLHGRARDPSRGPDQTPRQLGRHAGRNQYRPPHVTTSDDRSSEVP
ncbi:helix-turn-helix transcriptional regulator [Agromyces sp. NPDC058104]|uniref:helix-turn-helix transcriptional regulator n=1 Tax=Agromyces sp. NPDC058104 TaxID=3346342 RepID=UPI0036DA5C74